MATKLKITYVKDNFLDVCPFCPPCEQLFLTLFLFLGQDPVQSLLVPCFLQESKTFIVISHSLGDDWSDCFHVKNVALPNVPYLGFTAMTGDVSDAHEYATFPSLISTKSHYQPCLRPLVCSIVTVNTYSAILAKPDSHDKKKSGIFGSSNKPRVSDSKSPETWLAFFFKLFLLAAVCAGGYYGYQEYQRRKLYGGNTWAGQPSGGFGGGSYSNHKRF